MREGFVVGGRYRIVGLLATGSRYRVYNAETEEHGAGRVVVKVARHDGAQSSDDIARGRSMVRNAWERMLFLHRAQCGAAVLPLDLVEMYPGQPEVRALAMERGPAFVRVEPYLVCAHVAGESVGRLVHRGRVDEEAALQIALRTVLLCRQVAAFGGHVARLRPSDLMIDAAGENVRLIDVDGVELPKENQGESPAEGVPPDFGRLLLGLLAGVPAPEWSVAVDERGRWERLMDERSVPREYRALVLGCLGYSEHFEGSLDALENRLRALVRTRRARVYAQPSAAHALPYPLEVGTLLGGRFEVTGPLAQGARGFVMRCRDVAQDTQLLVKCGKYAYDALADFSRDLPVRRAELRHEYRVMKALAGSTSMLAQPVALVQDRGYGPWFDLAPQLAGQEPYLVMEHLPGVPLTALFPGREENETSAKTARHGLRPALVVRLVAQLAELLDVFHSHGFLFQDLKSENILFDTDSENVFLVDFAGVCPRLEDGRLDRTSIAFGTQTHGFAAPEFAELWERCDERFDVYSLGATAYHLLSGVNPEHVAIERSEEYPTLDLGVFDSAPPDVAELVATCLRPHADRFPTARAVAIAAQHVRLGLSRSRPLDVDRAHVTYRADAVRLRWWLPDDARITEVRVVTQAADGVVTLEVQGREPSGHLDLDAVQADTEFLVQTGLTRRGALVYSRGVRVLVEATPPARLFEADAFFGGNRLRCHMPIHAQGVEIRWSMDRPPAHVDDGEALVGFTEQNKELHREATAFHAVARSGALVHYACFVVYSDGVSKPRFADAVPLRALGEVRDLVAAQSASGVHLRWRGHVPGACVRVWDEADESRPPRLLVVDDVAPTREPRSLSQQTDAAGSTAGSTVDALAEPGVSYRYEVLARQQGVTSDALAEVRCHRWPEPPTIDVVEGVQCITLRPQSVDSRFVRMDVLDMDSGTVVRSGAPRSIKLALPRGGRFRMRVSFGLTRDNTDGPEVGVFGQLPEPDDAADIFVDSNQLPIALRLQFAEAARDWSGDYAIRVTASDHEIANYRGPLRGLEQRDLPGPCLRIADPSPQPGQTVDYGFTIATPDGTVLPGIQVSVYVTEVLPAPMVIPALARITVEPVSTVSHVDVHVTRVATGERVWSGVTLPWTLETDPGEEVLVRVRRSVDRRPMAWSPPTRARALRLPAGAASLVARATTDGVHVSWAPSADDGVRYELRVDGCDVYEGTDLETRDVEPREATSVYELATVRGELRSEPCTTPYPAPLEPPSIDQIDEASSVSSGRLVAERRVSAVRLSRKRGVVVVCGASAASIVLIVDARTLQQVDVLEHLRRAGERWFDAEGVVGVAARSGQRVLIPVETKSDDLIVLESSWMDDRPRWDVIATPDVLHGFLVGAAIPWPNRVHILPMGDELDIETCRLVCWSSSGRRHPLVLSEVEPLTIAGVRRGAFSATHSPIPDGYAGMELESDAGGAVLIPLVSADAPDDVGHRVWLDAAIGVQRWLTRRLTRALRGALVSARYGTSSRFHMLVEGRHVEVGVEVGGPKRSGGVHLDVMVLSSRGGGRRQFPAALRSPRVAYTEVADTIVPWIVRQVCDTPDAPAMVTSTTP